MVEFIIIEVLLGSFLIILIERIGLREKGQIYGPKLISKMLNCDFCLSFWVCVLISVAIFIKIGNASIFAIPFLATPVIRKLI